MRIEAIICDCCNEEIPKVKKKDIFGIEREYYRLGKLNYGHPFNDINCRTIGLHLNGVQEILVCKCTKQEQSYY